MKKLFYLFAVAVVAISLASCDKKKDEPTPTPTPTPVVGDTIVITHDAYYWKDATAAAGWWQIQDSTATYRLSLSNLGDRAQAAGEYAMEDMDEGWTWYIDKVKNDTIKFVDCDLTVTVSADARVVNVSGTLDATNGDFFIVNLTWTKPADPIAAREVVIDIPEATFADYASSGVFQFYGKDANYAVYLAVKYTSAIAGTYDINDLYGLGNYTAIVDLVTEEAPDFFSADITVEAGATEGSYNLTADVLCYDSVLYKISMAYSEIEPESEEDLVAAGELYDLTASYGLFQVVSEEDAVSGASLTIILYGDTIVDEFDKSSLYGGYVAVGTDTSYIANMAVEGSINAEETEYVLQGAIVCENKVQYNATITCPLGYASGAPKRLAAKRNFEATKAAVKALKKAAVRAHK